MSRKACEIIFIESAIKKVADSGLENLRTKQVADHTGFSEATLFRIFKTKESLLDAAFLYVDKRLSDIVAQSEYLSLSDEMPFEKALYRMWKEVYRHLLDNKEETVFLIRYRYSSLYTKEVRSQRQAYNGSFEKIYDVFDKWFGVSSSTYRGFLINYIFELTLCFADKVIEGMVQDTEETEERIWRAVISAAKSFTDI